MRVVLFLLFVSLLCNFIPFIVVRRSDNSTPCSFKGAKWETISCHTSFHYEYNDNYL